MPTVAENLDAAAKAVTDARAAAGEVATELEKAEKAAEMYEKQEADKATQYAKAEVAAVAAAAKLQPAQQAAQKAQDAVADLIRQHAPDKDTTTATADRDQALKAAEVAGKLAEAARNTANALAAQELARTVFENQQDQP